MASEDKKRVLVTLPLEKAEVFEKLAKELGVSKSALLALWISEKTK
ncbi:transcriptional regulator [Streptococcus agalactiae]|nr:transcriptional regulator [Streptococcus agalactiae]MCC9878752.1 transcriptional regulator [Streptococcus agalactiae]MCC9884726.1 transcriptional regulator [Streptococcus agalactiae]MCC9896923.1 transcriptional regulator [Streptococcus agalactiae]